MQRDPSYEGGYLLRRRLRRNAQNKDGKGAKN